MSPQIHVGTPIEQCRINNERLLAEAGVTAAYEQDVFNDLVYRYEEPNGMNRWDSPLFTILLDDETPPCDQIWNAVVASDGKIKTAKPNAATVTVLPAWDSDASAPTDSLLRRRHQKQIIFTNSTTSHKPL